MAIVLKIACDGEIYRLTLHEEPTYDSVARAVAALRQDLAPQTELPAFQSCARYEDEEGDLCTLKPQTFEDFLEQNAARTPGAQRLLKLRLLPPARPSPAPTKDGPPGQPGEGQAEPNGEGDGRWSPELPPGLAEGWAGEGQCRPHAGHGGPKRLLMAAWALREAGLLTPGMLTSLLLQGLPALTQRVARKVDKINYAAKSGISDAWRQLLGTLVATATSTPGLAPQAAALEAALASSECLGEALLGLLRTAGGLHFQARAQLAEESAEHLLVLLAELGPLLGADSGPCCWRQAGGDWPTGILPQHPGVTCNGCNACPILGPRFKCTACPDYDLCGNCYPEKEKLHSAGHGGAVHVFDCILWGGNCKGKGKAKGKAWARCAKGLGKGKAAMWAAAFAGKGGAWGQWPWPQEL